MDEPKPTTRYRSFEILEANCSEENIHVTVDLTWLMYPSFSELTYTIIRKLRQRTNLLSLDITFEKIPDEGQFLAEIMICNPTLKYLSAKGTIGFLGAQAIATALNAPNTHLKSLNLNLLEIGEEGAELIVKALETNTSLIKFGFFSSFDSCVARKALVRLEKGLKSAHTPINCYEHTQDCQKDPAEKIARPFLRILYFTLKNIFILIKANDDVTERATPIRSLPPQILLMILINIHPQITEEGCRRIHPDFFAKHAIKHSKTSDVDIKQAQHRQFATNRWGRET